jgi:hypothetical protein
MQTAKTIYESLLGENASVTSLAHIQVRWHYFLMYLCSILERFVINFVLLFPIVVHSVPKKN